MNSILSENFNDYNNVESLTLINSLKAEVDSIRPLDSSTEDRIMQKFRLEWNYNSNAIEGNSLDYGETTAFLMHGITAKGKPLKDYLDIRGHNEAIGYLSYLVKNKEELSEKDIRSIHEMLLVEPYTNFSLTSEGVQLPRKINIGEYKRMPNHVKTITGEMHYYASPEDTPILMKELVDWYRSVIKGNNLHPIVIAAVFHHRFTAIHPFDDGFGRMARLLMNLILLQYGYPPVVIRNDNKQEYYFYLSQADTGDLGPFVEYIASAAISSLNLYLRGARGENIDEPSDLRKKIALFKRELAGIENKVEIRRSENAVAVVYDASIRPFVNEFLITVAEFNELFFESLTGTYNFEEPKWTFSKLENIQHLDSEIKKSWSSDNFFILSHRFSKFKIDKNTFSIDIALFIKFDELHYSIDFAILDGKTFSRAKRQYYHQIKHLFKGVRKYYHQEITVEERAKLISTIGDDLLIVIKNRFENKIGMQLLANDIERYWLESVENRKGLDATLKGHLQKDASIKMSGNTIQVLLPEIVYNKLPVEDEEEMEAEIYQNVLAILKPNHAPFVDIVQH